MGSKSELICNDCGYTAMVSGGPDQGFVVDTQTGYCANCAELVDYVTLFRGDKEIALGTCHHCKKPVTQDWNEGDACPKCSGKFRKSNRFEMWD